MERKNQPKDPTQLGFGRIAHPEDLRLNRNIVPQVQPDQSNKPVLGNVIDAHEAFKLDQAKIRKPEAKLESNYVRLEFVQSAFGPKELN